MGLLEWFKRNRAIVRYNLGTSLLQRGDFAGAVKPLQKATELKPTWAEAYHNLGNALIGLHHYDAALAALDRAIALRPDFPEAHNNRGRALGFLGRYDEALEAFDRALELAPDYTKAQENRRLCNAWIEGSGPPTILPEQVPWLARLVVSRQLTWDQAILVIGLFIRLEERLYQLHKDRAQELGRSGEADLAQQFEDTFGLSARPDHLARLSALDQAQQDNLVSLVFTGGNQML
jgi:tetratricopeptide (TPR) repeat protein